jgi:Mg2+ and Co2+ transporter CorA
MKAKIVLTESIPLRAKVVLGHLEYEIEQESIERFLKEYHYDRSMWENVSQSRRLSELERANMAKFETIQRLAAMENPQQELKEYAEYLRTPIAVA